MNIKLSQLQIARIALVRLNQQPLPGRTAYRLSRIIKIADEHLALCEETRINLIMTHGHQDARGDWIVEPENLEAFNVEYAGVLAESIEIPCDPIPIGDLGSRFEASSQDLLHLDWLITE